MHTDAIALLRALHRLEPLDVLRLACRWAARAAPGDGDVTAIAAWVDAGAQGKVPVAGRAVDGTWVWAHQGGALTDQRLCVGHLISSAHLYRDTTTDEGGARVDLHDHAVAVAQVGAAIEGRDQLPWSDVLDELVDDPALASIAAGLAPGWRNGIDGLIDAARLIAEKGTP